MSIIGGCIFINPILFQFCLKNIFNLQPFLKIEQFYLISLLVLLVSLISFLLFLSLKWKTIYPCWAAASPSNTEYFYLLLKTIGPSGVCAPAQRSGHYTRHYFSFSLSFLSANQNPIRAYRRILNFCMGSQVRPPLPP